MALDYFKRKVFMKMTKNEETQLNNIKTIIGKLKSYLGNSDINDIDELKKIYNYISEIKSIQGNLNNSISYIACLMAKEYLLKNYDINNIDVSIKPQSANGLDIDEKLNNGERIICEIKTIFPLVENDFGSAQRNSFRNDFKKLNETVSKHKILFVTEQKAFNVLKEKYLNELVNVKIVLL